jgi:hypothetical protein
MVIRICILEHARKSCYTRATVASRSWHFRNCLLCGNATGDTPDAAPGAATPKGETSRLQLQSGFGKSFSTAFMGSLRIPSRQAVAQGFESANLTLECLLLPPFRQRNDRADRQPANNNDIRPVEARLSPKS